MKSHLGKHQTSTPSALLGPQESKHNIDIRLACVEDGIDNTGFRKISAYIKSVHPNTKVAYIPTGSYRSIIGYMKEKDGVNFMEELVLDDNDKMTTHKTYSIPLTDEKKQYIDDLLTEYKARDLVDVIKENKDSLIGDWIIDHTGTRATAESKMKDGLRNKKAEKNTKLKTIIYTQNVF